MLQQIAKTPRQTISRLELVFIIFLFLFFLALQAKNGDLVSAWEMIPNWSWKAVSRTGYISFHPVDAAATAAVIELAAEAGAIYSVFLWIPLVSLCTYPKIMQCLARSPYLCSFFFRILKLDRVNLKKPTVDTYVRTYVRQGEAAANYCLIPTVVVYNVDIYLHGQQPDRATLDPSLEVWETHI